MFYIELEQDSYAIFPFGVAVYWNLGNEVIDRLAQEICRLAIGDFPHTGAVHKTFRPGITGKKHP